MSAEPTLVRIRERSFPELLDLGLVVVRNRPVALGAAALVGVVPFAALNAWLAADPEFTLPVFLYLLALEAPWATAPLTVVLGDLMFGKRPTAGQLAGALLRGLPAMILYQGLLRGVLLVSFILIPLIPSKLAFLNEVILLERSRLGRAASRSSQLCDSRQNDLFGQWIGQVLIGAAFAGCFWAGTGAIVNALTTSELSWEYPEWSDLLGFRFHLAVWIAVAYFGVVRFLSYIDRRIRLEGWELKQRLQAAGRSLEEGERW